MVVNLLTVLIAVFPTVLYSNLKGGGRGGVVNLLTVLIAGFPTVLYAL